MYKPLAFAAIVLAGVTAVAQTTAQRDKPPDKPPAPVKVVNPETMPVLVKVLNPETMPVLVEHVQPVPTRDVVECPLPAVPEIGPALGAEGYALACPSLAPNAPRIAASTSPHVFVVEMISGDLEVGSGYSPLLVKVMATLNAMPSSHFLVTQLTGTDTSGVMHFAFSQTVRIYADEGSTLKLDAFTTDPNARVQFSFSGHFAPLSRTLLP